MGKREIKNNKSLDGNQIIKLCLISLILVCFNIDTYSQKQNGVSFGFENKNKILEWGEKEFGYCGDTINCDIEGKKLFILFGDNAFGVSYKTIFVFIEIDGGVWGLFCMRDTNTSSVTIDLNKERKELVFKSKSGKTLLILPFETINVKYDSKEQ